MNLDHDRIVTLCKAQAAILGKSQRKIAIETGLNRTLLNFYFKRRINFLEDDAMKLLECLELGDKARKWVGSVDASLGIIDE